MFFLPPVMQRMWRLKCGHISYKFNSISAEEVSSIATLPLSGAVMSSLVCTHIHLVGGGALEKGGALEMVKALSWQLTRFARIL